MNRNAQGAVYFIGREISMQELALVQPGRTLGREAAPELAQARMQRELESSLADCAPLAYRVAQSVLRNRADAEDVAQEALLRAYQKFHRLHDVTRFRAWLVRITFRLALDRWRAARRRERRETEWAKPDLRPAAPTTEEIAEANVFQARLEKALNELPEKFRLVLLLAAIEGYTLAEVAEMLGVPMGTVKSRLFFARKALAEKLR
jgi:RNA polymerase sigma-70 factor, ECF subfamily